MRNLSNSIGEIAGQDKGLGDGVQSQSRERGGSGDGVSSSGGSVRVFGLYGVANAGGPAGVGGMATRAASHGALSEGHAVGICAKYARRLVDGADHKFGECCARVSAFHVLHEAIGSAEVSIRAAWTKP